MKNTTLCYLEKGGAYLMLHRVKKKNDVNEGKWVGVGGHFEEGESPFDCAVREVFEETGFVLAGARYAGVVTFVSDRFETEQMHLFHSTDFLGEDGYPAFSEGVEQTTDCIEGNLAWVDKDAVPRLPLWEGDRIFLALLKENVPHFSLKLAYTGDALTSAVLDGVPLDCSKYLA